MSWAPQVIADASGKFFGNALRFATYDEAYANVLALQDRWFLVREVRVIETNDPVNVRWVDGKTEMLETEAPYVTDEIGKAAP
jgi:hypothetical protein